jgi:hypothetical protein
LRLKRYLRGYYFLLHNGVKEATKCGSFKKQSPLVKVAFNY